MVCPITIYEKVISLFSVAWSLVVSGSLFNEHLFPVVDIDAVAGVFYDLSFQIIIISIFLFSFIGCVHIFYRCGIEKSVIEVVVVVGFVDDFVVLSYTV